MRVLLWTVIKPTMKHFNTTFVALSLSSSLLAQVPSYVPTDGLVGWWPFNGNAEDESGIGNHGTVNGPTLTTDRFGVDSAAYYFDGLESHIRVPDSGGSTLDLVESYTLSCWALIGSLTQGGHHLITKHIGNIDNQGTYTFVLSAAWVPEGAYFLNAQATPEYTVNTYPSDTDYGFTNIDWYHLCVTYNDADDMLVYYINGSPYDSVTVQFEILDTDLDLLIGTSFINSTSDLAYSYHGKLDDIGIWNRDMSASEIADLFLSETVSAEVPYPALSSMIIPNPTSGMLRIVGVPSGHEKTIHVHDATGRRISIPILRQESELVIDLSAYPTGLYIVRVADRSFPIVRQ